MEVLRTGEGPLAFFTITVRKLEHVCFHSFKAPCCETRRQPFFTHVPDFHSSGTAIPGIVVLWGYSCDTDDDGGVMAPSIDLLTTESLNMAAVHPDANYRSQPE